MENPKLKIESDGKTTEIYFDGKKIDSAYSICFNHTQGANATAYVDTIILNENGTPKRNENDQILIASNKLL